MSYTTRPPFCRQRVWLHFPGATPRILIAVSLQSLPVCQTNKKKLLVRVMVWHHIGNKPLSIMMTSLNGTIFRVTGPSSPVHSTHKGQSRGTLMFSLICAWTGGWADNWDAGDLRRYRAHYDVTVMTNDDPVDWYIYVTRPQYDN